jgi:peroxiredoxin Q/BCP
VAAERASVPWGRDPSIWDKETTMTRLETGDRAPAFSLPDHDEKRLALKDLKGKPVVVYFYPADDTPGCTKEACQFNENLSTFNRAGVTVLGISPDGAAKHQRFRQKYGLKFSLLSDPEHKVMEAYGAWGEKTLYGKKSLGVIRSTFLVDETGVITRAWYNVRADGHASKVLELVKPSKALK